MINGELAAAVEQVTKLAFAPGAFEDVGLFDSRPGQAPPLGAQGVELVSHGKLLGEKRLGSGEPFCMRNDRMLHGQSPSDWVARWVSGRAGPEASFSHGDRWKRLISR